MRLKDKIAIIFGAGQSPGNTPAIGNGRAVSLLWRRLSALTATSIRPMKRFR